MRRQKQPFDQGLAAILPWVAVMVLVCATVHFVFALWALSPGFVFGATVGTYSRANTTFYLQSSPSDGTPPKAVTITGARRTWLPILGDWSGDRLFDYGLYDPKSGTFHLRIGADSGPITESFQFQGFK